MRLSTLIPLVLFSVSAQAAQVTTFNKECLDNEAAIVALQALPISQPLLEGEVCERGQLTAEDLSFVESVQPANAVRAARSDK